MSTRKKKTEGTRTLKRVIDLVNKERTRVPFEEDPFEWSAFVALAKAQVRTWERELKESMAHRIPPEQPLTKHPDKRAFPEFSTKPSREMD